MYLIFLWLVWMSQATIHREDIAVPTTSTPLSTLDAEMAGLIVWGDKKKKHTKIRSIQK